MQKVVFTFGRANPPTVGHEKLAQKVHEVARKNAATPLIFLSQTQDKKKNPLSHKDKTNFMKLSMPKYAKAVQTDASIKTIIDAMKNLQKSYESVILVVGSDRVDSFKKLLTQYNGKEYNFDSIDVVSAGARDPDADGVEGMSASKMRQLAADGDFDTFQKGLASFAQRNEKLAQRIYNAVRTGMQIREGVEEDDDEFLEELEKFIEEMDNDSVTEHLDESHLQDDLSLQELYKIEVSSSLLEFEGDTKTKILSRKRLRDEFYEEFFVDMEERTMHVIESLSLREFKREILPEEVTEELFKKAFSVVHKNATRRIEGRK